MLLQHGANIEARTAKGGWTPLLHAAKAGRLAVVRTLVAAGANVHVSQPVRLRRRCGVLKQEM